jgi:P-type conjugative transfer protein TrbJ
MNLSPRSIARRCAGAVVILLALTVLTPPRPATAQFAVIDAANLGVNATTGSSTSLAVIQRILQIANELQQIRLQIEQLIAQYQNLVRLGIDFRPIDTEILRLIHAYQELLHQGKALVYTLRNLDDRFKEVFDPGPSVERWRDEQLRRVETVLDTHRAVLKANQAFARNASRTQVQNEGMKRQALATEGNLEALHAQALIQAHTAQEISKTVEQLASVNNLLAVHFAYEVASQESAERSFDEWLAPLGEVQGYDGYRRVALLPELRP